MRKLEKPCWTPLEVFSLCISTIHDANDKKRFVEIAPDYKQMSDAYNTAAATAQLHTIHQHGKIKNVEVKELKSLYSYRMQNTDFRARVIYDEIKLSAPNERCPLCIARKVRQVDHHLPQSKYPLLSICPFNLLPVCSDCNKDKLALSPTSSEEECLHPYYDDVQDEQWLFASVIENSPGALHFEVRTPDIWGPIKKARVENHFSNLKLDDLFATESATVLTDMQYRLINIHESGGAVGVREHLEEEYNSCRQVHLNYWKTVMFQTLSTSQWFCEGGFR